MNFEKNIGYSLVGKELGQHKWNGRHINQAFEVSKKTIENVKIEMVDKRLVQNLVDARGNETSHTLSC